MKPTTSIATLVLALSTALPGQARKEFKFNAGPGATMHLTNRRGDIDVKPAAGKQALIVAIADSNKVEIDARQSGARIDIRTHALQKTTGTEDRVKYEITLPADTYLNIHSSEGNIRVENVRGALKIDSDAGNVDVRGATGGVAVQTISGSVTLADIKQSRVNVTSTGGNIALTNVTGDQVSARSTSGNIRYTGDFAGGGTYSFTNHSGEIEAVLPAGASVEIAARSVKGSVENDFPLDKADHPTFQPAEGRSLVGKSKAGESSVELRSFSGKIRIRKR
jgi:DUF4097 and DUF4098 domain-containing protein YvlB